MEKDHDDQPNGQCQVKPDEASSQPFPITRHGSSSLIPDKQPRSARQTSHPLIHIPWLPAIRYSTLFGAIITYFTTSLVENILHNGLVMLPGEQTRDPKPPALRQQKVAQHRLPVWHH